jgi:streptogramin lyase
MTTAEIIQGEADIISPAQVATDAQGEASFVLRAGESEEIIRTRVAALDQEVQFQSFIVALANPAAIAVEADGSLVVVDQAFGAVVRVSPSTGDLTLVSGLGSGTGPPLVFPGGIAVEADGSLVVVDRDIFPDSGAVVRVNPVTGDRALISRFDRKTNTSIGNGPLLVSPADIAVEADGSLIVVDTTLRAVLRVDPFTGNRTLISR